jgi:hypothetical protein
VSIINPACVVKKKLACNALEAPQLVAKDKKIKLRTTDAQSSCNALEQVGATELPDWCSSLNHMRIKKIAASS